MFDKLIFIKTPSVLSKLEYVNKLSAEFFDLCKSKLKVGVSKVEIEEWFIKFCEKHKVKSAFFNYHGFPNQLCISINTEIIHGLVSDYQLQDGDIITLDVGIEYDGFISDNAETFIIGNISSIAQTLIKTTYEALYTAISNIKPFIRISTLSKIIYKKAIDNNLKVLYNFGGHGVGYFLHEKPSIPNVPLKVGIDWRLRPGMVIAVEPIFLLDDSNVYYTPNGWTLKSSDLSAHVERSVAILTDGCKILSQREEIQ